MKSRDPRATAISRSEFLFELCTVAHAAGCHKSFCGSPWIQRCLATKSNIGCNRTSGRWVCFHDFQTSNLQHMSPAIMYELRLTWPLVYMAPSITMYSSSPPLLLLDQFGKSAKPVSTFSLSQTSHQLHKFTQHFLSASIFPCKMESTGTESKNENDGQQRLDLKSRDQIVSDYLAARSEIYRDLLKVRGGVSDSNFLRTGTRSLIF